MIQYTHYAENHDDRKTRCGLVIDRGDRGHLTIARLEDVITCPNCIAKKPGYGTNSDTVEELITGRRDVYGDPEVTFREHAEMFTVILNRKLKEGERITPEEVVMLMMGYKLVRAIQAPDYSDNIDDVVGYADIFKLVQGDRFIQARTVDEYLEKKAKLSAEA